MLSSDPPSWGDKGKTSERCRGLGGATVHPATRLLGAERRRWAWAGATAPQTQLPCAEHGSVSWGLRGQEEEGAHTALQHRLTAMLPKPPEITSDCPQSDLAHTNPSVARALPNPRSVERKTGGTCACSLAENCPSVCYADGHIVHTWRHSPGSLEGQGQGGTTGVPGPFGYQGHPGPGLSRGC